MDANTEVGEDTNEGSPSAIVGWAAAGLGVVPLALWIASGGENSVLLLSPAFFLLGIAAVFLRASSRRGKHSTSEAAKRAAQEPTVSSGTAAWSWTLRLPEKPPWRTPATIASSELSRVTTGKGASRRPIASIVTKVAPIVGRAVDTSTKG